MTLQGDIALRQAIAHVTTVGLEIVKPSNARWVSMFECWRSEGAGDDDTDACDRTDL